METELEPFKTNELIGERLLSSCALTSACANAQAAFDWLEELSANIRTSYEPIDSLIRIVFCSINIRLHLRAV